MIERRRSVLRAVRSATITLSAYRKPICGDTLRTPSIVAVPANSVRMPLLHGDCGPFEPTGSTTNSQFGYGPTRFQEERCNSAAAATEGRQHAIRFGFIYFINIYSLPFTKYWLCVEARFNYCRDRVRKGFIRPSCYRRIGHQQEPRDCDCSGGNRSPKIQLVSPHVLLPFRVSPLAMGLLPVAASSNRGVGSRTRGPSFSQSKL